MTSMATPTPRSSPARIRSLSERLANQIAAGEVVERPASVLKELLENSLDAGATRIGVDIEHGGGRLIRVRDDGNGIYRDDLALALERHATSKIASLEDLENVASLGFRGEALPSIASVSRLELSSCPVGEQSGWTLTGDALAAHGTQAAPLPTPHPQGTTVSVRDLFYNTPARRKFLRTEKTEYRHLEGVFKRAALSRFDCAFSLRHNGRDSYSLPAATNDAESGRRVAKLCGAAFLDRAHVLSFEASDLELGGWIGGPGYSRAMSDLQYFFVNGRMVRDNLLRHAVRHAHAQVHAQAHAQAQAHDGFAHSVAESGRQPAYVLYLNISPSQVDVNVHPSKHEVRFRDARSVHDFIVRSLRQALLPGSESLDASSQEAVFSSYSHQGSGAGLRPSPTTGHLREQGSAYDALRTHSGEPPDHGAPTRPLGQAVQQLDRRYVVARNERGLVVVDACRAFRQVAATRLAQALENDFVPSRPLLVPVAMRVDEERADLLESHGALLEKLGFDLRRVAPESISCRAIPAVLATALPEQLVNAIGDALRHEAPGPDSRDGSLRLLHAVLEQCDLTAAWSWDRDAMDDLLRQLERQQIAPRGHNGQAVWRQLSADDIAGLL